MEAWFASETSVERDTLTDGSKTCAAPISLLASATFWSRFAFKIDFLTSSRVDRWKVTPPLPHAAPHARKWLRTIMRMIHGIILEKALYFVCVTRVVLTPSLRVLKNTRYLTIQWRRRRRRRIKFRIRMRKKVNEQWTNNYNLQKWLGLGIELGT